MIFYNMRVDYKPKSSQTAQTLRQINTRGNCNNKRASESATQVSTTHEALSTWASHTRASCQSMVPRIRSPASSKFGTLRAKTRRSFSFRFKCSFAFQLAQLFAQRESAQVLVLMSAISATLSLRPRRAGDTEMRALECQQPSHNLQLPTRADRN